MTYCMHFVVGIFCHSAYTSMASRQYEAEYVASKLVVPRKTDHTLDKPNI